MTKHSDALTIYQDALDFGSAAVLNLDHNALRKAVLLPYLRKTSGQEMIFETLDDMASDFADLSASIRQSGANAFVRLATHAEFLGEDYIEGYHTSNFFRGEIPTRTAYYTRMVLKRSPDFWKMVEVESNPPDVRCPVSLLTVNKNHPAELLGRADDIRKSMADPHALYQHFLDALTDATFQDDFSAYCNLCSFPFSQHGYALDLVMNSPKDARPTFDAIKSTMEKHGADRLVRHATAAHFIGGNRICGYHTVNFLRDRQTVFGPVMARMILSRDGVNWALQSVTHSLANTDYPFNPPVLSQELVTLRQIQERTKRWPIFQ